MVDIKVSVIIPVYNVELYLERCLESVLKQTLDDIEIIVVNDGSTDNSKNILMKYIEKYPEKIFYLEKENGGLSDARNFGIPYAKGEYITFLDSDDYIECNAYEEMYLASHNGEKNIIECDFIWEFSNKRKIDKAPIYKDIKDFLKGSRVVAWNKLYKKEWLLSKKVLFHKGVIFEDVEFFFSLMPQLNSISEVEVVRKPFIHYVQRDNSILDKAGLRTVEICDVYLNAFKYLKDINKFNDYKEELEYKFIRNVLWGFPLKRVRKIKNKDIKKKVIDELWKRLMDNIPNWKKNKNIKLNSIPNIYLTCLTEKIYKFIFVKVL